MEYMTLKEASEKWGVSPRWINYYCVAGRILGAVKMTTIWLIPKTAPKPTDGRRKEVGVIMDNKILLVDDEKDIVDLLDEVLQKEGFHFIQKAYSGMEALNICREFQPDVIVLDIMLSDIDGLEVCKKNPGIFLLFHPVSILKK